MKPIQYLIDGDGKDNGGILVTTKKETEQDFEIKPCIDDRMFVCCLVRDDALSKTIKAFNYEEREYEFLDSCVNPPISGASLADELYKFIYIETSITCNSNTMKKRLLKASVYDRWINYGTIHAVSHHSILCITSSSPSLKPAVINPFLTQLVEMAVLTVTQRSLQLLLFNKISQISESFSAENELSDKHCAEIERLQEIYVKYQNQLMLTEVTVQEQGIELYDMLQEMLYITKNKRAIDEQMSNLRDVSNISHERLVRKIEREDAYREKKSQRRLSALSILFTLFAVFESLTDIWIGFKIIYPVLTVCTIVAYFVWEKIESICRTSLK